MESTTNTLALNFNSTVHYNLLTLYVLIGKGTKLLLTHKVKWGRKLRRLVSYLDYIKLVILQVHVIFISIELMTHWPNVHMQKMSSVLLMSVVNWGEFYFNNWSWRNILSNKEIIIIIIIWTTHKLVQVHISH